MVERWTTRGDRWTEKKETNLGIVYKRPALAVRRKLARRRILQTFDDGSLARSIVPNNQRQRRIELDGFSGRRTERADALDGQFVDFGHGSQSDKPTMEL